MTLQYRPVNGGLPYSPARDILFCYPDVFRTLVKQMEAHVSTAGQAYLDATGVKDEALAEAVHALVKALLEGRLGESLPDALARNGWNRVPVEAQFVVFGYLGQVMTATFYWHFQDAMAPDEIVTPVERMRTVAALARRVFAMSPWRRTIYFLLWRPLRMALRRFWTRVQNLCGR